MKSFFFTHMLAVAMMAGAGLTAITPDAEAARRFGGGKSIGKQSDNVTRQAPPAAPSQAAPAPQKAAPAAAPTPATPPAAQPARNRWLGPLAGIAAGLGIAALLSHFGMAGAFAEAMMTFLMIGALILAALFVFRMLRNRNAPPLAPATGPASRDSLAGMPLAGSEPQFERNLPPAPGSSIPVIGSGSTALNPGGGTWTIPAGFDVDNFLHIAKMYFVRLQAAWDAGDERDIRNFTTPEVFAEAKLDLNSRAEGTQTDVVRLDAQLLGVEELGETTLASVRLTGLIRETKDGVAEPFDEVWNLEKPSSAVASWVLGGIQQRAPA